MGDDQLLPQSDPNTIEYGDNVVGLEIKVWWPEDIKFYGGTVKSYDDKQKMHEILYHDGETEKLNLEKETWHVVLKDALKSEELIKKKYGDKLVGSHIQILWPNDHMLYYGYVESYDVATKKHKILYIDGENGELDLDMEFWQVIKRPNIKQYGDNLVGSKIKVWWPQEFSFFEAEVESFDDENKEYQIVYADGEEGTLNPNSQLLQVIKND